MRSRPTPPIDPQIEAPVRTCVGCRRRAGQASLQRFALDGDELTAGRHLPGRGAWICSATLLECFDEATAAKRWSRALRARVSPASIELLRSDLARIVVPEHR